MVSLESRLDRLTPGQRKEAEEFIDYLLWRDGERNDTGSAGPFPVPLILSGTVPPVTIAEPEELPGSEPVSPESDRRKTLPDSVYELEDPLTRDYLDYGSFDDTSPATAAVKRVRERLGQREKGDGAGPHLEWVE